MTDYSTDNWTDEDWAAAEAESKKEPTIKLRFCYDCPSEGMTVAEIEVTEIEDFENLWEDFAEFCSTEDVMGAAMANFPIPGPPEMATYNGGEMIPAMVHNAPPELYDPLTVSAVKEFWGRWIMNDEVVKLWESQS